MTLLIMTPRPNVPRRCAISFFAPTLTFSAGSFLGDPLARVEPIWRCGFSQVQRRCGRSPHFPHLNVIAYRGMWEKSWRDRSSVVTTNGVEVTREGQEEAESTWQPVPRVVS